MARTTIYDQNLPDIGGDAGTWGTIYHDNINYLEAKVRELFQELEVYVPQAGDSTISGALTVTGGITSSAGFVGNLSGNCFGFANGLSTARTFSLTGIVTAEAVSFNGLANVTFATVIADGALSIAKTDGLQTEIDKIASKQDALSVEQTRSITYGTGAPSGTPADGDIYLQYTA